jgi:hypothetical protein
MFVPQIWKMAHTLVQLLEIIGGHGVNTTVLGTIDIVLVTKNAISSSVSKTHCCMFDVDVPDAHTGAGDNRQADGSRETLITLRIIILEADLELDSLEEVTLLGFERVLEKFLDVGTHSGCGKIHQR